METVQGGVPPYGVKETLVVNGKMCTSATGRESHQGRLGCYRSEEAAVHRAVDVCPCYVGGMLSSWS